MATSAQRASISSLGNVNSEMVRSSTFTRTSVVPVQVKRRFTGPSTFTVAELVARVATPAEETEAICTHPAPASYSAFTVAPASAP